jgi:elongation factor P hydroxylase
VNESLLLSAVLNAFEECFGKESPGIRITGGHGEPFYRASTGPKVPAEIQYREDFLNSCLHEISHWLVAGKERRDQDDFGYAYAPDGRNPEQQRAFYQQEIKPQALEWELAKVLGLPFKPSADNLNSDAEPTVEELAEFQESLRSQQALWVQNGFPVRAGTFIKALKKLNAG